MDNPLPAPGVFTGGRQPPPPDRPPAPPSGAAPAAPPQEKAPRRSLPALLAILVLAAVLYGWNLSGDSLNSFYSAAVHSGTKSWEAWFFGSLDAGNFITVDKPPFALMVMGLSCRVLGFGTWQMMAPEWVQQHGTAVEESEYGSGSSSASGSSTSSASGSSSSSGSSGSSVYRLDPSDVS